MSQDALVNAVELSAPQAFATRPRGWLDGTMVYLPKHSLMILELAVILAWAAIIVRPGREYLHRKNAFQSDYANLIGWIRFVLAVRGIDSWRVMGSPRRGANFALNVVGGLRRASEVLLGIALSLAGACGASYFWLAKGPAPAPSLEGA